MAEPLRKCAECGKDIYYHEPSVSGWFHIDTKHADHVAAPMVAPLTWEQFIVEEGHSGHEPRHRGYFWLRCPVKGCGWGGGFVREPMVALRSQAEIHIALAHPESPQENQ